MFEEKNLHCKFHLITIPRRNCGWLLHSNNISVTVAFLSNEFLRREDFHGRGLHSHRRSNIPLTFDVLSMFFSHYLSNSAIFIQILLYDEFNVNFLLRTCNSRLGSGCRKTILHVKMLHQQLLLNQLTWIGISLYYGTKMNSGIWVTFNWCLTLKKKGPTL